MLFFSSSLCSSPANTSSDFAIAKQIQEDLNQLSLDEEEDEEEEEEELPPGAVGVGLPDMSNFEGLRFPSDDPNYYGTGYEIGGGERMLSKYFVVPLEGGEGETSPPEIQRTLTPGSIGSYPKYL